LVWIVAVYVAAVAFTIEPAAGRDPPPHNIDPPAYGGGFVIVPVIVVVVPEVIANGIDSVSFLEICCCLSCADAVTLASVSVNVPG
jgi:hypothetical protein